MDLEIRLFATLKDRAGHDRIQVTVSDRADVRSLLLAVASSYPGLEPALPTTLVAVNKAYAGPDTILNEGDEIAFFPPVSGGSDSQSMPPTFFSVTSEEVELSELYKQLSSADIGAIVTFTGFVRGQTQREGLPSKTLYLEYEAYEEMALEKMSQIADEIWRRWPLVKGVAIVQHVGKLDIGQITTVVACAAAHRDQGAFEAARYGIDRLKEIVPVWKKEVDDGYAQWVEGSYRPTEEDN